MADRLLTFLAKWIPEVATGIADGTLTALTGKNSDEVADSLKAFSESENWKPPVRQGLSPETKDLTSAVASENMNLGAPETFASEGGSLSPEDQTVVKTPETFAGQKTNFWTGKTSDMSEEDNKLVNGFMGADGNMLSKEQVMKFTDQEKTKMLFDLTGESPGRGGVDLDLSRLLYKATNLYDKNARR
ncbi:MAG: hypothetical protein J7L34_00710 [Thermotogaceae bacterium]|nr:hypothetical protein [Thermotogaceae bacterium]